MDSISNIDQLISYIRKLSEEAVGRLLNYHHTIKNVRNLRLLEV